MMCERLTVPGAARLTPPGSRHIDDNGGGARLLLSIADVCVCVVVVVILMLRFYISDLDR